jgi:cell wall-associated NlpC family hydrolase
MEKLLPLFFVFVITLFAGCATTNSSEQPADHRVPAVAIANVTPAASGQVPAIRMRLTSEAEIYIGTPYASPPNPPRNFDCSSFVSHVYAKFGHLLPRVSSAYGNVGTRIDWKDAQPGDILVFSRVKGSSAVDHVAMLWKKSDSGDLAGSQIIHSASINTGASMLRGNPNSRTGVVITQLGLRGDGRIENEYFYQRYMFSTRVLKE